MSALKLQRFKVNGLRHSLHVLYSPGVAANNVDREKLYGLSPVRFVIRDKLSRQPSDALSWSFTAHTSRDQIPLAVMRNRLTRKWNEAMRAALKHRGFECDGKRPARHPGQPRAEGLKGTMLAMVFNGAGMGDSGNNLFASASAVVRALEAASRPQTSYRSRSVQLRPSFPR